MTAVFRCDVCNTESIAWYLEDWMQIKVASQRRYPYRRHIALHFCGACRQCIDTDTLQAEIREAIALAQPEAE